MRQMSHFELSDKLRDLTRSGAEVPLLTNSPFSVDYVRTDDNGIEIYRHGGAEVSVHPGEVIDSHGNVINLRRLEAEALARLTQVDEKRHPVADKYQGILLNPNPSLGEPSEHVLAKYANLLGAKTGIDVFDKKEQSNWHPGFSLK